MQNNNKKSKNNLGINIPTIHEFIEKLTRKKEQQSERTPSSQEEYYGPLVDPIICNGIADILIEEREF